MQNVIAEKYYNIMNVPGKIRKKKFYILKRVYVEVSISTYKCDVESSQCFSYYHTIAFVLLSIVTRYLPANSLWTTKLSV